jgi:hypothetical protein
MLVCSYESKLVWKLIYLPEMFPFDIRRAARFIVVQLSTPPTEKVASFSVQC